MTDYHEYEGKSVEKALESASKALGKAVEELQYEVVSYGSSGIFGFVGVKKAKVRVRMGDDGAALNIREEVQHKARDLVDETFENGERSSTDLEQVAEQGKEALQRVIDYICEGARIETEQRNGRIIFKVEGGNSALLIGKRGQTLEAIQYLLEKMVNRHNDTRIRVLVDVEGYLGARKTNLKKLASKLADKAHRINKPVTIGQMNAYDRRIVHLHLKDNQAVRTQSVGEGYYRKLIIFPKRRRRGKIDN